MRMLRRSFLLGTAACVIAGAAPSMVFATPIRYIHVDSGAPIATLTLIKDAMEAATKLGLSSDRQMKQFGFETDPLTRYNAYDVRAVLYDTVVERHDVRVWNNLRCVLAIHDRIVQNFPHHDPAGVAKSVLLDGKYVLRDEMAIGIDGLRRVAMDLGAEISMHTLDDLRAFG